MARLSMVERDRLTPALARYVERSQTSGQAAMFQILGHCPDMFEAYFRFYFPWHTGGAVDPVLKELLRLKIARLNDCFT